MTALLVILGILGWFVVGVQARELRTLRAERDEFRAENRCLHSELVEVAAERARASWRGIP